MRVGIDIGGTFTDGVLIDENGRSMRAKVLTTPARLTDGLFGVFEKLGVALSEPERIIHGTTIVTNLILQRRGCRVGMLTTRGFRDVVEIGTSLRRNPLDLRWTKPEPLVPRNLRKEIDERTTTEGVVERAPGEKSVLEQTQRLLSEGADAIAICFLNSYVNSDNEREVGEIVGRSFPDIPVSLSSNVDPQIREYERFSTTVMNAYAVPETRAYLKELREDVRPDVLFMHSGGGVLPGSAVAELPIKLVMSGPAGGVVATQRLGEALGEPNLITLDMGGTSTDVAVIADGTPERTSETEISWGLPFRAESLGIRSIGAGGGSIAARDSAGGLQVGPMSAGADPGPACYGRGGAAPTVTDANLVLGLLHAERFLGGEMRLDEGAAVGAIRRLADEFSTSVETMAKGIHEVVNANMAGLIREMTVACGRDPRRFVLVSFGGAGGQHAAGVAELIGCREVLFPRDSSTFSALGLANADVANTEAQTFLRPLDRLKIVEVRDAFRLLERRISQRLGQRRGSPRARVVERQASIRYVGQTHEVAVSFMRGDTTASLYDRFQDTHLTTYGTQLDDPAEVVSLHSTVVLDEDRGNATGPRRTRPRKTGRPRRKSGRRWLSLFAADTRVVDASALADGHVVRGPAVVEDVDTTIVVPPGGMLESQAEGSFRLTLRTGG